MSQAEFGDRYIEFLLGTLDEVRRQELEEHAANCSECRRHLAELEETLHSLPLALPQEPPPAEVKQRLMEHITAPEARRETPIRGSRLWSSRWAIAASILAIVSLGLSISLYREARLQEQTIATLERESQLLRAVNQGLNQRIDFLIQPGLKYLTLVGLTDYEAVSASAFLDPELGRASLFLHELPEIGADRDLQLWVIERDRPPYPANVFQPAGRTTELQVELPIPAERVITLAITIEPPGGSPQPTGPMVAAGNL